LRGWRRSFLSLWLIKIRYSLPSVCMNLNLRSDTKKRLQESVKNRLGLWLNLWWQVVSAQVPQALEWARKSAKKWWTLCRKWSRSRLLFSKIPLTMQLSIKTISHGSPKVLWASKRA
jgi:hypothetical protein